MDDNDAAGQVFAFVGFNSPEAILPFDRIGRALSEWLLAARIEHLLRGVRMPDFLAALTLDCGLRINFTVLH